MAETAESLVSRQASRYIGGREIPRDEAGLAFEHLRHAMRVLLSGGAGSGKSVVVAQVIRCAQEQGWPVMALSADSGALSGANGRSWGESLGLPESPAVVLANIASGESALLVIDQVDAVGSVSGRHEERREVVEEMLRQASGNPEVRVLVACRKFDLDHDRILRRIAADEGTVEIAVRDLDEQVVRDVLGLSGSPVNPPPALVTLLRVPLHLALYVDLAGSAADLSAIGGLDDLYRAFCEEKRRACRSARGEQDDWLSVVDALVDRMDETHELWAPLAIVSDFDQQYNFMASEGVLVQEGARIRFFHETLFDYCFAERFISRGQTLHGLLTSGDQDLFRRAQVRQILTYQRASDFQGYLREVKWMLTSDEVRLHLKVLVVLLTQVTRNPTCQEWELLRPIAGDSSHLLYDRLWGALRRNPAWFPVIDQMGEWAKWLASPESRVVNGTVWALGEMAATWPQRTADLMQGLPAGDPRDGWVRTFLQQADVHAGHDLLDLMVQAIASGLFDANGTTTVWLPTQEVARHRPDWGVDLLEALLTRMLELTPGESPPDYRFTPPGPWSAPRFHGGEEAIAEAAREAPIQFVNQLLPRAVEVLRNNALPCDEGDGPRSDRVWRRRFASPASLVDALFSGLETSLAQMASSDPVGIEPVLNMLQAEDLKSAWVLLARALAGNPDRFADRAVDWLVTTPGAFDLDTQGANHWVSRELIAAVSTRCSPERLERLVDSLLYYTTRWDRTYAGLKGRGWAELCLLNGLDPERWPDRVQRRLAELRRKFRCDDVPAPSGTQGGGIPAPIPENRASMMNDSQWLRAMAKHGDNDGRRAPGRPWIGDASQWSGASQWSQVLEGLTKQQPSRFARLLLRMSSGTSTAYVSAVLTGIAGAGLDSQLLLAVVERAQVLAGAESGRWVAWLAHAEAGNRLPTELLDIVAAIAAADPDPKDDAWWQGHDEDPQIAGMHSARGAAASAIEALIGHDPARLPRFAEILPTLVTDPTVQVRAMAAGALVPILGIDPPQAIDLFHSCVATDDDRLLAVANVDRFLNLAIRAGHYGEVDDVLTRMRASRVVAARRAGARQLTVASYLEPDLDPLINSLLSAEDEELRAGAVEAIAALCMNGGRSERSLEVLTTAFNDPSNTVRQAAVGCLRPISDSLLVEQAEALTAAFTASESFRAHAGTLLLLLEQATVPLPKWVLDPCERYLALESPTQGVLSVMATTSGYRLVKLVVRMHAQYTSSDIRRRCLDLMDRLLVLGAHDIDDALTAIER